MRLSARLVPLALPLLLAACASPQQSAVFVTRTSLGMDVDSAPVTAAFGYNRVEGYLGPRYNTGTIPAVVGTFHTTGGLFNREIRQLYATGKAAVNAISGSEDTETEHFEGDRKAMFFGTGTIFGLNLGFGETGVTSFTLGFKRKEISVIPVADTAETSVVDGTGTKKVTNVFPSVFARLDDSASADVPTASKLTMHQVFATGVAAQHLAVQAGEEFKQQARDPKAIYRDEEHRQTDAIMNTLWCLSKVSDADLPKVWGNAESLGVFNSPAVMQQVRDAKAPAAARSAYTGGITLVRPNDPQASDLLALHRKFVCNTAGVKS